MSPARRPARSASGPFDRIRTQDAEGRDLWSARDIQPLLDYSSWDKFRQVIAQGQTYFALQTRRQELSDSAAFAQASEDGKRLAIRQELSEHNRHLAAAAKDAGVDLPENLPTPPDSIRTLETRQRKELGGGK